MKRTILTGTAIVGALIVGVAIGTSGGDGAPSAAAPTVTETATETVTVAPEPAPEPTEQAAPAPEPAPEPEPETAAKAELDDISAIAINAVWDSLPSSEQDDICLGWLIDDSQMLDAFMEGAGEDFDRALARDFFDGKCL